jgi:hypothetical protein
VLQRVARGPSLIANNSFIFYTCRPLPRNLYQVKIDSFHNEPSIRKQALNLFRNFSSNITITASDQMYVSILTNC